MNNFFTELKRRNVVKVAIAYVVVSWVILQFVDVILEFFTFPAWFPQMVLVLLIIGFPIALLLSWAYEVTPEGVKKTHEVDKSKSITHGTGQKINKLIIGALVLAVAFLLFDKFMLTPSEQVIEKVEAGRGSIAVLPFSDLSPEGDQEYFSDGISEGILNVLVRVEGLSVASRTSSFAFKGRNPNIPEIAATLNVDHILEGSVRRSGDTVRITAQLIDVKTDRHLWLETYDRELTDIFEIQDEISKAIVRALKETLGIEIAEPVMVGEATGNMTAYDLYLRGRGLFLARENLPTSVTYLEQAVELDDGFARAWESLAAVYSVMPAWEFTDRPYLELAIQAADKAISLDSNLSLAYSVKGKNLSNDAMRINQLPDWKASFDYLDQAIENNPKDTTAYLFRGYNHLFLGFFEKAIAEFNACLRIDPAYGNCKRHKAIALIMSGQGAAGVALYKQVVEEGFPIYAASGAFLPALVKEGYELAVLIFWRADPEFDNFPASEWIAALKNPGADHREGWDKAEKWAAEQDIDLPTEFPSVLLVFKQYDQMSAIPDFSHWIWWPEAQAFRQTVHFKRIAEERNYPAYWFEFGFPPFCRPVGVDDFECD